VVAISADRPAELAKSLQAKGLGYALYSDSSLVAARAFGIAYQLDDTQVAGYAEHGIDLEAASGQTHHQLPVPSVFLVERGGTIRWVHSNPDYRVRPDNAALLEAVGRLEEEAARQARFAALGPPEREPVDVASLLEGLLEARRAWIQARRLVVLQELDRADSQALGDASQLRFALEMLIDELLASAPERGSLYVATGRGAVGEKPSQIRILLRGSGPAGADFAFDEKAPSVVMADSLVRAQGGVLTVSPAASGETIIRIELPAR
jgi:peroxiredoxin